MAHPLKLRLFTAAILIPAAIAAVIYLESEAFALSLAAIICLAAWEWSALIGLQLLLWRVAYLALVIACMIGAYLYQASAFTLIFIFSAVIWWFLALIFVVLEQYHDKKLLSSPFVKAIVGLFVLVPAWLSVVLLQSRETAFVHITLFFLVLIWTADSSAYFAGKRWGKSKLANKVSPGKTWEGVLGALAGTSVIVLIYVAVVPIQAIEIPVFLLLCIVTILVSILGDLLESMMKRSVNLKDSGGLLPGHGGVLDRIDSITAAAPVFFIGLWLMEWEL